MFIKTRKIQLALFITISVGLCAYGHASAHQNNEDGFATTIETHYKKFETMLNTQATPETMIEFLHNAIDNNAKIHMVISNHDTANTDKTEIEISKADYINSYLYGPRQIGNYHADVKVSDIKINKQNKTASATETLTETGYVQNPKNYEDKGDEFTSQTVCTSHYSFDKNQAPVLKASNCKTDISSEINI